MVTATRPFYDDEYLGPVETSIPSPPFVHNATAIRMVRFTYKNNFIITFVVFL